MPGLSPVVVHFVGSVGDSLLSEVGSELAVAKYRCDEVHRFFLHLVVVESLRNKPQHQNMSYLDERSTNTADMFFLRRKPASICMASASTWLSLL